MPLAYRIDQSQGIVVITGDYAEPPEWRELLTAISQDAAFRRGLAFIRDLRTSQHPVSADSVVGIVAVVQAMWERLGVRRAAMVTRPGVDLPAVVAHALAEDANLPLRAFTSYEDAVAWLMRD
jgi:hypothetical protein